MREAARRQREADERRVTFGTLVQSYLEKVSAPGGKRTWKVDKRYLEIECQAWEAKAERVRSGWTRAQVLALLGPPTWALLSTDAGDWAEAIDSGFNLMWRNGKCNPVTVTFDNRGRVNGKDEGRAACSEATWTAVPGPEYSCKKRDRAKYCR